MDGVISAAPSCGATLVYSDAANKWVMDAENNQPIQQEPKPKGKHGGARRNSGGARPGAGRKQGSLQKLTAEAERQVEWTGQTPAEFFQQVMQDEANPVNVRIDAAKAAAVYVHRKQPEAHEVSAQVSLPAPIIVLNDHDE